MMLLLDFSFAKNTVTLKISNSWLMFLFFSDAQIRTTVWLAAMARNVSLGSYIINFTLEDYTNQNNRIVEVFKPQ